MQDKGKFPSQTQLNSRGMHEVSSSNETNPRINEVKVVITLKSGKEVKQPVPKPAEEGQEAKEAEPEAVINLGSLFIRCLGHRLNGIIPFIVWIRLHFGGSRLCVEMG